jgi:carbonic anhydrase
MDAAIAFAVKTLDVSSIVVCGHSSCGAMNAVLRDGPNQSTGDEVLDTWLEYAWPTLAAFDGGCHPIAQSAAAEGFDTVDQLSMVNVALQVQTLTEHPLLRERYQQGRLDILGLFYDIPSAAVLQVTSTEVSTIELGRARS